MSCRCVCWQRPASTRRKAIFECAVKDGTLVLRSNADTNVYEMMKSLDDDFRDLLKGAGVSLSGLFLL